MSLPVAVSRSPARKGGGAEAGCNFDEAQARAGGPIDGGGGAARRGGTRLTKGRTGIGAPVPVNSMGTDGASGDVQGLAADAKWQLGA